MGRPGAGRAGAGRAGAGRLGATWLLLELCSTGPEMSTLRKLPRSRLTLRRGFWCWGGGSGGALGTAGTMGWATGDEMFRALIASASMLNFDSGRPPRLSRPTC